MSEIYELEEVMEQPEDAVKGFSITDDNTADWALKRIAEERKELERLVAIADQQIEELELKKKHLKEITERKTAFLKGCLAQYFEKVPHKATKTQETYKLLSGSLVFKLPKQTMVKDDAKLLKYLHENGMEEYIKTEEKPKWGDFKKTLTIVDGKVIDTVSGEVVEAVRAEEEPGSFDVKV